MALFGGGTQKVKTKVDVPHYFAEQYKPVHADLAALYQQQFGQGGLNPFMQMALEQMGAQAQTGSPLMPAASGAVQGLLGQRGGLAPRAFNLAQQLTSGNINNPALKETRQIARGRDVGSNPFLDAAYGRAAGQVTQNFNEALVPGMDQAFAQSGRLGSGAYAQLRGRAEDRVGDALGDLATGIYGGAYEGERGRQMQALGQWANLGQQDVANRMAGAGLMDQGTARQLQAATMAPGLADARFGDLDRLYQAGAAQMQAPWAPAQAYLNQINVPGLASMGVTKSEGGGGNPFLGMLQGGMGGAQTAGSLGLTAAMMGSPLGIGTGTLLGGGAALGGLLGMLSDKRAKRNLRKVGKTKGGQDIYTYEYAGGGPAQMGVLAQDALKSKRNRGAVGMRNDGYLMVDYRRVN